MQIYGAPGPGGGGENADLGVPGPGGGGANAYLGFLLGQEEAERMTVMMMMMTMMMELYHTCIHCVTAATVTMRTTIGDRMETGTATLAHCQTTVVMLMMSGKMLVVMMVRTSGNMMKTMYSRPSPDQQ